MNFKKIALSSVLTVAFTTTSFAAVSPEEAKKLGNELTPMGAIKAGNKDGSIPAWTGSLNASSKNMYASEKPLFVIDASNYEKYKANLSEGEIALFKTYPKTFKMPIYKSHRDVSFSQLIYDRSKWNASNTITVNGIDGLRKYTGGAPFPIPNNGAEAMWNARVIHPHPILEGQMDDIAVFASGSQSKRRQLQIGEYPYAYDSNPVGKVDEEISVYAAYVFVDMLEPKQQKGQMTIVHEPLDNITHSRNAWVYIPGTRRVRRAPTVGFDTPDGPGGLMTVDDNMGFNGAFERYEWKLLGKKEIYIPYNNYKFDSTDVKLKDLLTTFHPNPEYMRYEKHRVWVVEATLKANARHLYSKRRFYIDEDTLQVALIDSYDGRGGLWRVGMINAVYEPEVKGAITRAVIFHDLDKQAYIASRLVNETGKPDYKGKPKGANFYTPKKLRKLGKR